MKKIFTRHALKRIKNRNLGMQKTKRAVGGGKLVYLGNKKYKSTRESGGKTITVIYKKDGGKNIAITAWKG
ncbi:MAG: DUF4258 domain-containing protein [Patescibacteria group bacterium]